MNVLHPARAMPFKELKLGLEYLVEEKTINVKQKGDLRLYCYSETCVYERRWDPIALLARGLIIDVAAERVVATPFPKFFNVGENIGGAVVSIPAVPFETFEKLDGSLIILFYYEGSWQCATKGSFESSQAQWARNWVAGYNLDCLNKTTTYLLEAIYPENKIVVRYNYTGCVLLGTYAENGEEYQWDKILRIGKLLGWRVAQRHQYNSVTELLEVAGKLTHEAEGFVLRFANGLRLKIKGEEYCRIHRMVSHLTPLSIWEALRDGVDLEAMRRELPEEFWQDFDTIQKLILKRVFAAIAEVNAAASELAEFSDKDIGLKLASLSPVVRKFIFPWRKNGGDLLVGKTRTVLFEFVRPTANVLEGYAPSNMLKLVAENN